MRALAQGTGRAAAWHIQGPPRNAAGHELCGESSSVFYVNRTTSPGSRVTAAARPQFAAAMVVVEARAIEGLSTTQLADYAAMRAYAQVDPARLARTQAPTILTILEAADGDEVPLTLTEWDACFLRGLYNGPANLTAAADRSAIRHRVEAKMARPETPAPPRP